MKKIFIAASILLSSVSLQAEAASIYIAGSNGNYTVNAADFTNVGGVEVEVQYDTTALANPQLFQGPKLASTMFIPNPKFSASSVKIAAMTLSGISGSGILATIRFDVIKENPLTPAVVRQKITTTSAAAIKPDPPSSGTASSTGGSVTTGGEGTPSTGIASSGGGYIAGGASSAGTITLPQDQVAAAVADRKTDSQPLVTDLRKDMTLPLGESGGASGSSVKETAAREKQPEKKSVAYKGVLQHFKEFKGERNAQNLIGLFAETAIPDFRQEPAIAFSDGSTPVKITLEIRQTEAESPKFLLQGAKTISLNGAGEDKIIWTIEALPNKGVVEATLTVIDGKAVVEIPLTVALPINPLLTKGKAVSVADFAAYLAKPSKYDLNKDEKFNSIDDFIYTANYIAAMKITPEKVTTDTAKEPAKTPAKDDNKQKESPRGKDDKAKPVDKTKTKR